jgi:tight adherence protein B
MSIAIACFVAVLSLLLGAYWFFVLRPETAAQRTLSRRLNPTKAVARLSKTSSLLNEVKTNSTLPVLARAFGHFASAVGPVERMIERSGYSVSLGQIVLGSAFAALLGAFAAWQLTHQPLFGIGAGLLLGMTPFMFLKHAASRRMAKFEEHFPEAIDLIARALRAGHAFTTGLGMVADEIEEPVRTEFRLLHDRQNYGMPLPDAMRSLAVRVPLLDARFFATAVLTQRESGGNLSEVLDNLSKLIRERFKLKRQVRTLSAHGRITGWVLAALPIVLAALMLVIAPGHMGLLFTDPLGIRMVVVAGVLQVIGSIAMRRIVNIEI